MLEQVGLAGLEQLLQLLHVNRAARLDFLHLERAALDVALRVLAQIQVGALEHFAFALGTHAQGFLAGEINFRHRAFHLLGELPHARREVEADLAVLVDEERLELAVRLVRHEAFEQFGLALGEQLHHLRALDGLLENDRARLEVAGLGRPRRLLADVIHPVLEDASLAFRTQTKRLLAGEIHRRGVAAFFIVVAEIELDLVLRRKLDHGGEGKTLLAAEALERPDLLLHDELLHFLRLEHPTAQNFPHVEVAVLAFELAELLVNLVAALGAAHHEHAEIAGDGVLVVELGLADDLLGEAPDLRHELFARDLPALHLLQLKFPVARHLGLAQLLHAETIQQLHQ